MQGENSDSTHPVTATTITEDLTQASTDISKAAVVHILALTHQPDVQPDSISLVDETEQHIAALVNALANDAPHAFRQFIQTQVAGASTPERSRIVIEVLGQVIRQQMGEQTWPVIKPILDPALEWLAAQTNLTASMPFSGISHIVPLYTQNILKGDRIQAEKLVFDTLAQGHNLRDVYLKIIQPSLYEVGRLWEIGRISIPQEHLATAITQSVLSAIYARVALPSSLDQHALVTCLEGNYHEIGPRMLADFLQLAGYNTRFLGTNTSVDCLLEMIQTHKPDVIGLPATTLNHVDTVKLAIDRVRVDFASYRPTIMVGGLAFNLVDGLWKTVKADLWSEDGGHAVDQLVGTSDWV